MLDGKFVMQVMDVNANGVLFTAQAAGRQMEKFGNGGSIILIASMSGSITNKVALPPSFISTLWLTHFYRTNCARYRTMPG